MYHIDSSVKTHQKESSPNVQVAVLGVWNHVESNAMMGIILTSAYHGI